MHRIDEDDPYSFFSVFIAFFHFLICKPLNQFYVIQQLVTWNFLVLKFNQTNRGDFTRHKKERLRLNAINAAKKTRSLSNLEPADPFFAETAIQNSGQTDLEELSWPSVLTRRMRGRDEESISQARRKQTQQAFSENKWKANKFCLELNLMLKMCKFRITSLKYLH